MKEIRGSGGKGGGNQPSTTDVSGISSDRAEVVLGICEGQIEGTSELKKRIYFDNTILQNSDDTFNFEDIDLQFFSGTSEQGLLPGTSSGEISTPTNINLPVVATLPVTRSINNPELNAIRIRIAVRLQKQEDDGDVKGSSLRVKIFLKEGVGAFILRIDQEIKGRFPDLTVFAYLLQVNPDVSDYSIRIEKVGADSTDQTIRELQWLTYEEVVRAQLTYPNTSAIWLQYPPNLFRTAPSVTAKLSGYLAQIPSTGSINTNDRGIDFTNIAWNGTFYTTAIANTDPAWLLWAYLTNKIWGLAIADSNIDRYAFYQASLYNNQLIADGFGSTERRFSFRGQLNVGGDSDDRYETARQIAATFAAKIYHNGLQYTIWQDRPSTVNPRIVANADVADGIFLYTTQDYSAIATACYVWRNDPDQEFQETPEPVEFPGAIARYGYKVEEFRLIGETRRGGAVRAGRRVILNSLPSTTLGETGLISFKMRSMGLFFELGEIVQIVDSARNNDRKSGLIRSATTTQITLDHPCTIESNSQLYCVLPNLQVEVRPITNNNGSHSVLSVSIPFSSPPLPQSTWQVVGVSAIARQYRIVNITPDVENGNFYEVSGKLYDPDIYNKIENGWGLTNYEQSQITPTIIPPARNLAGEALTIDTNGSISYSLSGRWDFAIKLNGDREPYVQSYAVEFRRSQDGEWGNRQISNATAARWENIGTGLFYVRVAAIGLDGRYSGWIESGAISLVAPGNQNLAWLMMMDDELDF